MVKRQIDSTQPAYTALASTKGLKRPRTNGLLEKTFNFDKAMGTCRFFATHLIDDARFEKESNLALPSADSIRDSLMQSMITLESEHRSCCAQMRDDARSAIHLHESFQRISNGIDSKQCQNDISLLSMLNLGSETNHFLKQTISEYAGVPSSCDLQDWKNLDALLR